jgi:hypothetical protein
VLRSAMLVGMEERYYSFDVLPSERRSTLLQQQIDFLETAYREGFRSYTRDSETEFGASSGLRYGLIWCRTKQFWELRAGSPEAGSLAAFVSGFDVNAEALLRWLRGEELLQILEYVRPNLVAPSGHILAYRIHPPATHDPPNTRKYSSALDDLFK